LGGAASTVVVLAIVTVNEDEVEVLPAKIESPRYLAISACAPTARPEKDVVATPADKVAAATTVVPSRN
jgi:hypothetical protein